MRLIVFICVTALVFLALTPQETKAGQPNPVPAAEMLISKLINAERAKFAPKAPRLSPDTVLNEIARKRSAAMARGASFSHEDASGKFIAGDMMHERFGPYGAFGENILKFYGFNISDTSAFARNAVERWMKSPSHRANILSPTFNRSGVGIAVNGRYVYVTQLFMALPSGRPTP